MEKYRYSHRKTVSKHLTQFLKISVDLHYNGQNSFYSGLKKMTDYYNITVFNCNLLNEHNNNKQQPQQQQVYFKLSIAYKVCVRNLAKAIRGGSTREKRKFEQKK